MFRILIAFLVSGFACTAAAEPLHRSQYLVLMGGVMAADGERDVSAKFPTFHGAWGIPLPGTEGDWAAEIHLYASEAERDVDGESDYQRAGGVDAIRLFGSEQTTLRPFVVGGLSVHEDDWVGEHNWQLAFNAGAGSYLRFGDSGWALRGEARLRIHPSDVASSDSMFELEPWLNLGVHIPLGFGGSGESKAAPRRTLIKTPVEKDDCALAVVRLDGGRGDCGADSDADGVADEADLCPGTAPGTRVDTSGCAPAFDAYDANQLRVLFASNSAQLDARSLKKLNSFARLHAQDATPVDLEAHADASGNSVFNQELAGRRAESVRAALIKAGIASHRISMDIFGDTKPVESNDTPAGRALNRRVDAYVRILIGG